KKISEKLDCDLIFAGEPLSEELKCVKKENGLNGRVIEVPRPSDAMLEALYNRAFALLYPTKHEGFGWPAIEAQTCGCPVISSNSTSIPEVVGESALLRAPEEIGRASCRERVESSGVGVSLNKKNGLRRRMSREND